MQYTNLHQHSHYSNLGMLDAYGTVEQIVQRAKDIGYTGVALTDHGSVSWHIELIQLCEQENLKPICGCEMYIVDDLQEMIQVREKNIEKPKDLLESDENLELEKQRIDNQKDRARKKYHFNVLAKNQRGLEALWKLVSQSYEEGFYFKPTLDWSYFEEHKDNLLFWSACEIGILWRSLDTIKLKYLVDSQIPDSQYPAFEEECKGQLRERFDFLIEKFGENFYVEILPIPEDRARWKFLLIYQVAREKNILTICTNDSHAPTKEDTIYQDMLYCANLRRSDTKMTYNTVGRPQYTPGLFYMHSAEEMLERMATTFPEISREEIIELMNNSQKVVDKIEAVRVPKISAVTYSDINDTPENRLNLYKEIKRIIGEGWKKRKLNERLTPDQKKIYQQRIISELEVILNKGYIDYFMIMADVMNWCETDRPYIENFELWYRRDARHLYPGKSEKEVWDILNEKGYFEKKKPIGTGIARGSAGWSLVAYLMSITNIDPIPWALLFERFIDYTRWNVYYNLDFRTYSKEQFKKDYPEEDSNRLEQLKKYIPEIQEKADNFLQTHTWYDKTQIGREFWLLEHNQKFSREQEYFLTVYEKVKNKEITEKVKKNESNSILAYVLGIVENEPQADFKVALTDIPDIDSDFEDARRDEVYVYLRNRWGYHNTCRIATYTILKDKSAIDMLARIFPTEDKYVRELKEAIEEYKKANEISTLKSLKVHDFENFFPTLSTELRMNIEFLPHIPRLLNQVIALWMHPAGMIVHNNPVSNYGAIYQNKDRETGERVAVLCWDSVLAESLWLMKLDILWLNTVTNIKTINRIVKKRHNFDHHWQDIPNLFEDENTKQLMKDAKKWRGLFQLEGSVMLALGMKVKPDNFEEVIFVNAGWRPGPLRQAMTLWDIKEGTLQPYYYNNETYRSITETRGWMLIYQEDIMQVSRLMCKYDDAMVWKIRKIIAKSKKQDLDDLEPDFKARLIKYSHMSEEGAQRFWDSMKEFWRYAFNKAHSEAYSLLAYIQGYYKANYPLEFYAGMLKTLWQASGVTVGTSKDKIYMLLKDYEEEGYKILSPDINKSQGNFFIDFDETDKREYIRVWFTYIKGIKEKPALEIVSKQPYNSYEDFIERIDRRVVNAAKLNALKKLGVFNTIGGAPDIDEKLVDPLSHLENTQAALELLTKICREENYVDGENIHFCGEDYVELLTLLDYKEDVIEEAKSNTTQELSIEFIKKIRTKLVSRLKSTITKTRAATEEKKAGALSLEEDQEAIILEKIELLKDTIDNVALLMKGKEIKNRTIYTPYKGVLEVPHEEGCTHISCSCQTQQTPNYFPYLWHLFDDYAKYFDTIIKQLNLSTEKVIIKPTYKDFLQYCPILAKADLTKYKSIGRYLKDFVPLSAVNFDRPIYSGTFVWVLIKKTMLPDQENKRKMKASLIVKTESAQKSVFVSGGAYLKNKEEIDNLQEGDPVILVGSAQASNFQMISLTQIDSLKDIYSRFQKKIEINEILQNFKKQEKEGVVLTPEQQAKKDAFLASYKEIPIFKNRHRIYFI